MIQKVRSFGSEPFVVLGTSLKEQQENEALKGTPHVSERAERKKAGSCSKNENRCQPEIFSFVLVLCQLRHQRQPPVQLFAGQFDDFQAELIVIDSAGCGALGKKAGGGHTGKGVGFQAVERSIGLIHKKIYTAVGIQLQNLMDFLCQLLYALCIFR